MKAKRVQKNVLGTMYSKASSENITLPGPLETDLPTLYKEILMKLSLVLN